MGDYETYLYASCVFIKVSVWPMIQCSTYNLSMFIYSFLEPGGPTSSPPPPQSGYSDSYSKNDGLPWQALLAGSARASGPPGDEAGTVGF